MNNQPHSQDDIQAVVNTLLTQLKQQSAPTKTPQPQSWVERHLSAPKSLSEVIWRLSWLLVVPGIFIRLWLPLSDWCWVNGLPIITIFVWLTLALVYLLFYHFAVNTPTSKAMRGLLDVQFAIPPAVVWFVLCWEFLNHGK